MAKCLGCGAAVAGRGGGSEWRGSYALCGDCVGKGAEIKRNSEVGAVACRSHVVLWRKRGGLWQRAAARAQEQREARLARRPVQGRLL